MSEITHRQMRNDSGEVLRRVADGETIVVTNHGLPAAVIGPPYTDIVALLSARGQMREAIDTPDAIRLIRRRKSEKSTKEIIADTRGTW